MAAPPKPVNEMTDAEIEAWADEIFDEMRAQRPIVEAAGAWPRARGHGRSTWPKSGRASTTEPLLSF